MQLRVRLRGSGTDNDPYRVSLPTYTWVHGNITNGYAIVRIPDETHGLSDEDLADEMHEETTEGPLYSKLSDTTLAKVHSHFDNRYQELKGKFKIEPV